MLSKQHLYHIYTRACSSASILPLSQMPYIKAPNNRQKEAPVAWMVARKKQDHEHVHLHDYLQEKAATIKHAHATLNTHMLDHTCSMC